MYLFKRSLSPADYEAALAHWSWLPALAHLTPRTATHFGDVFLEGSDGIWFLDIFRCGLIRLWDDEAAWLSDVTRGRMREDCLRETGYKRAEAAGLKPSGSDVISVWRPPLLGGTIQPDDLIIRPFVEVHETAAIVARRLHEGLTGTQVLAELAELYPDAEPLRAAVQPEVTTTGWDAITGALEELYPGQEPIHVAGIPHPPMGGDYYGISAYSSAGTWHLVTYAFSDLFDEWARDRGEPGDAGLEFTLRIPAESGEPPDWAFSILGFVCRWLRESQAHIDDGHFLQLPDWLPEKGWARPWPAVAFLGDVDLDPIETPNGPVMVLQAVGLSPASLAALLKASPPTRQEVHSIASSDHPGDGMMLSPATLPIGDFQRPNCPPA